MPPASLMSLVALASLVLWSDELGKWLVRTFHSRR